MDNPNLSNKSAYSKMLSHLIKYTNISVQSIELNNKFFAETSLKKLSLSFLYLMHVHTHKIIGLMHATFHMQKSIFLSTSAQNDLF